MNAKGDKFIGGAYYANSQRGYAKVFESNEFCATPLTITIHDGVFSNFSYSEGSYCTADNDPTPTISGTSGGTFSSTTGLDIDASTGEIDLSESTEGRYTVTYIVSNTNCADTTTQDVWITESTIGFGYGTTVFCINTDDPTPTITAPVGGTFTASSGLIVDSTSGVIDLTNSPVGVYDVLYTPPLFGQLGTDIDGESVNDNSGRSVAFNAAGNRIIIGANGNNGSAPYSGHARVYDWDGSAWTQVGGDINGEAGSDYSGWKVAMNNAGNRVLVGAIYNTGNGYRAGHARMFSYDGTNWVQMGSDIDGENAEDEFSWSAAMNGAGSRVVISAYKNDGTGTNAGHTRIFEWDGTTWNQLGSDIDAEAAEDQAGYAVSMSDEGDRIAIGANYNDGAGTNTNSGHVRIYDWNGSSWVQVGSDINGEAAGDESGYSVSLNKTGNLVAIGAPKNDGTGSDGGQVRVYSYNAVSYTHLTLPTICSV